MNHKKQMNKCDIDKSDYEDWLKHAITKEHILCIKEDLSILKKELLELNPIENDFLSKSIWLRGQMVVYDRLLRTQFEDLFKKEEDKSESKEEESSYSW